MPLPKRPVQFSGLFPQQFNSENDQAKNKDEQTDAVNAMHITDPFTFRPVRVLFFKVEIFRDLVPDTHLILTYCKFTNTPLYKERSPGRIPGRSHKKTKLLLYEREFSEWTKV